MTFLASGWLWLLAPLLGLVAAYLVLQRRRRHFAVRFTNLDLLESVAPRRPGWRRHLPAAAAAVGIAVLVVAMARPAVDDEVGREEATVVMILDVSESMRATDVAPSRLAAAQDAATGFVAGMPDGYRVGLVAFDGTARVLAMPTTDHAAVTAAVDALRIGPGTAAGDAVEVALETLRAGLTPVADLGPAEPDEQPAATIVLLSDGGTTTGRPLAWATQAAANQGVPVTTIAYGTDHGTVTIEGEVVDVPADRDAMRAVAAATGGTAFAAGSAEELTQVYDDIGSRMGTTTEQRELWLGFVGAGVVVLMVAAGASMLWSARFL